jgi:hypothetical protein
MTDIPPRTVTLEVDSPNRPQPPRVPGQLNEIHAVIGRIPVPHAFRPPRSALRTAFDQASDWFWFVVVGLLFIGLPAVGIMVDIIS